MKRYFLIWGLLLLSAVACQEDKVNERFMGFDEESILTYLQNKPEYSEWYKILQRSGLAAAFNYSSTPITFFAMKNEVVDAYLKTKGLNNADEVDAVFARQLIQYHTIVHKAYQLADFREGKLLDSTASGDYLSCKLVYGAENADENGIFINRLAKIIVWDIEAVNGMIHELDQVVDPVTYNLYDFLVNNEPTYSILRQAYEETGLDTLLTRLDRTEVPLKCRRTLFVTSDAVFEEKAGIRSYEELKAYLGAGDDVKDPANALNQFLRYRILDNDYSTTEFAKQLSTPNVKGTATVDPNKGTSVPTLAENKLIQVQPRGIEYNFNETMTFVGDRYNMQVRNGFVHEVDGIFEIFEPEQIVTTVEVTDFINFEQIPEYRNDPIQKTMIDLEAKKYFPWVTWKSTPADKKMAVTYIVFTTGSYNFKENGFINGDCLYADLGPVGQLDIKTRPIPKGKYKISLHVKAVKVSGGIFQPYLDDEKTAGLLSAYGGLGYDAFNLTSIGTFTFDETTSHSISLKVSSPGELHLDLILFEPVN